MELQNDLLLKVARLEPTERTPVWVMRQAGRILPEYRAVRSSVSGFIELVSTPELAAEVTIQPVDILGVDAAIIFSDILVVPEAMGLPYEMVEKKGPYFPNTVRSQQDFAKLHQYDPEALSYVIDAIKLTKKELNGRVPLIGFAGAPWTIFAYMVEGKGSKTFSEARKMLYMNPELSVQLLEQITDTTIAYLKAQIEAGADLVQLFDSWAGLLTPGLYEKYAIPYLKKIADAITEVPLTIFAKDAYFARRSLGKLNCNVVGMDWCMDIKTSIELIGKDKAVQGNLDPCVLYSSFDEIKKATIDMLDQFKGTHHIANLGHGVYPDINPEKVKCFIDTVKEYS